MPQIIDSDRSERGPQRKRSADGRLLHCCCICGKLDTWGSGWTTYCSERDLDDGIVIPKFCSDRCRQAGGPRAKHVTDSMKQTAKQAEMRDPIIIYRDMTEAEKYAAAIRNQKDTPR